MLPPLVAALVREGWKVEADGRIYRPAGSVTLNVRSGIDWFELHGVVDYEGMSADLPALLAAARRGESFVRLGDGSFGVMPADWLARHGRITALGVAETDHVRFASSQGALLDAWLATQPAVSCDETFARVRQELVSFKGVEAVEPPPSFRGTLRDYQSDALAWFEFLRRFGFGGCLADEMGLGKTVMVLAALEARREQRHREGRSSQSSLIVVPRSLVFNWQREAARFAPGLRVLDYSGQGRRDSLDELTEHDIVLTTYGTLRRDIGHLKDVEFDYVILDEAQAIKNATHDVGKGGAAAAREASPRADGDARRESPRRAVEPVRLPQPRPPRGSVDLQCRGRVRPGCGPGDARRAGARAASVHPPPHEGSGRQRAPGADRADLVLRARGAAARALCRAARPLSGVAARSDRSRRPAEKEAADSRGAAALAPGGVPSRPRRPGACLGAGGEARRAAPAVARARRGWPQGRRVLAVHEPAGAAAAAARRGRSDL